jgi:hypothetical protein
VTSTTGSTGGFLKYPSVKVQPRWGVRMVSGSTKIT